MGLRFKYKNTCPVVFLTTTVVNHLNLFDDDGKYQILIENLRFYLDKYRMKVIAYVLMPGHFHLIIYNLQLNSVSMFMAGVKKSSAIRLKRYLKEIGHRKLLAEFGTAASGYKRQKHKIWMDRFDAVSLYSLPVLRTKMDYIHSNPVRKGLVKQITDWRYSSARDYYDDTPGPIPIWKEWF
jgi:REP element-mobilizing transposase RayT